VENLDEAGDKKRPNSAGTSSRKHVSPGARYIPHSDLAKASRDRLAAAYRERKKERLP